MDTLKAMQVFVEVAKCEGFAPAAKRLQLSTSSVSRHILNLETQLNCQLFNRTTRHLTLTETGSILLERCRHIVAETSDLFQQVLDQAPAPTGRLKITMPQFLATLLTKDVIAPYVNAHPAVALELVELNRIVNLVEEDFDLAVRVGDLPDSSLIARKLVDMKLALVASPAYLNNRSVPATVSDITDHHCIVEAESPYKDRWPFVVEKIRRIVQVNAKIKVNTGERARDLAASGMGLALLPIYMVLDEIRKGELVRVLDDKMVTFGGINAVYPNTRYQSTTVRTFIDALKAYFESVQISG